MGIRRIVVTGDWDRPLPQHGNILFFYGLIKTQLALLTGMTIDVLAYPENEYLQLDAWLKRETSLEWPRDDFSEHDFVIGFEMSEALILSLKNRHIPFLAFDIDPVRFLDDLCLRITDVSEHIEIPVRFALSDLDCMFGAAFMAGLKAREPGIGLAQGSVLVIGQTMHDRTVIHEGRFYAISDYIDAIKTQTDGRELFYKPHPFHNDASEICLDMSAHDVSAFNIYRLLSQPEFEIVIGLSSSVLTEAIWFQKTALNFLPIKQSLLTVHARDFISTVFWHSILWQIMETRGQMTSYRPPYFPGMLRAGLATYWGYDLVKK